MLKNKKFDIIISSDLQYEELCSEIYFEGQFVALITREDGLENAIVNIYPPSNAPNWIFTYSDFIPVLNDARDTLKRINEIEKSPNKPKSLVKFDIMISSPPDRERLVAEIWYDNMFWVEITHEDDEAPLAIQFYPHPKDKHWEFPLDQALEVLERAKKKLLGMGGKQE